MKKLLLLTTTPTAGGNGDALIAAAARAADGKAELKHIKIREKDIHFCNACHLCRETGICVQNDSFHEILAALHEADALIAEAPIYYNCIAAQALTVINRLCCTFTCKTYRLGPKKRVGVMLTCTGSDVAEMKRHIFNITSLPSISRSISEARTEVFTHCTDASTCKNNLEYLQRARDLCEWSISSQ